MALSSPFSLQDVNTELGTSNLSLDDCFVEVGEPTWDRLSDFDGFSNDTLTIDRTNVLLAQFGSAVFVGENVVTITSNTSWTITKTDTWITLSTTAGSGNGSVTITASKNLGITCRYGSVSIVWSGIRRTITVSQRFDDTPCM